jgi:ABC-type dipeptide/oligopeptide/nickel transport system permease component
MEIPRVTARHRQQRKRPLREMPRPLRIPALLLLRLATRIPVLAVVVVAVVFTAPGFDSDERRLDMRLSADTLRHLDAQHPASAWEAGRKWFMDCLHGDLGESRVFGKPVAELMRERIPVTARASLYGLFFGWAGALCAAGLNAVVRVRVAESMFALLDGVLLCIPAAVMGFLAVLCRLPVESAIALIVFARAHTWVTRIHKEASAQPWMISACAYGISRWRILLRHILPQIWPQLAAVMAASVTLAIGISVPVEVICDTPGLGQLAWRATLGRDLPVLLAVTLCMAACSIAAACISDAAGAQRERSAS